MPLTVPTLTVVDNADGTGAVAMLADGSTDAETTIRVAKITGTSAPEWDDAGSRIGNGTVALAIAKGYWWVVAHSTLDDEADVSNLVYLRVSDAADNVHWTCMQAAKDRLLGLVLPLEMRGQKVYLQVLPDEASIVLPCMLLTLGPSVAETEVGYTDQRDKVGYPVRLWLVARQAVVGNVAPIEQILGWRRQVMRAFSRWVPDIPGISHCMIEPGSMLDPEEPKYEYLVSQMTLRFIAREPRGLV